MPDLFSEFLRDHLRTHPVFAAEDVYKFTHQSVFGAGHIMPSEEEARDFLQEEAAAIEYLGRGEPAGEPLSEEPALSRLHLEPVLKRIGGVRGGAWDEVRERILEAMKVGFARAAGPGSVSGQERMLNRLEEAKVVVLGLVTPLKGEREKILSCLDALAVELAPRSFPPVRHRAIFRDRYRPAYRVGDTGLLQALLRGLGTAGSR